MMIKDDFLTSLLQCVCACLCVCSNVIIINAYKGMTSFGSSVKQLLY